MTVENQIRTAYANHLLLTFGAEGLAMFHDLPTFEVVADNGGSILVATNTESESQRATLTKALELFADAQRVTIYFDGDRYTPALVSQAA